MNPVRPQQKNRRHRHNARRTAIALTIAATAAGAALATPALTSAADALERARTAAQAFSGQLRATLQAAMQGEGPVAAVEVCHAAAPAIADEVMREHGVRLGRVALPGRNRHPDQSAQDWRLDVLQNFQRAVENGAPAAEQVWVQKEDLPAGVALRMMRGIATEAACTTCHGVDITSEVRAAITRHYPADNATGFEVGDLRGALWVEVPTAVE